MNLDSETMRWLAFALLTAVAAALLLVSVLAGRKHARR